MIFCRPACLEGWPILLGIITMGIKDITLPSLHLYSELTESSERKGKVKERNFIEVSSLSSIIKAHLLGTL